MNTKNIAIVGGKGTVAQAIGNGLINHSSEYGADNIFPVYRDHFKNDFSESGYLKRLNQCETVVLAVKPKDAVEALALLRGKVKEKVLFISTVSGLGVDIISIMLGIPHEQIVKLTLNINVEYGKGIIIYSAMENASKEIQRIFTPLSKKMIRRSSKRIIDGVVYTGSESGFSAKNILLDWKENSSVPFVEYIQNLTVENTNMRRYIETMESTCDMIFHGSLYDPEIFESTLETLRVSCTSEADVMRHIERVATPGGCTREGIDEFNSLEKVNVESFMNLFYKVKNKANSFKKTIRHDFKGWQIQQMKSKSGFAFAKS